MGLFDRFRRSMQDRAGPPPSQRQVGPSESDIERVKRALLREAERLGRTERLSLSVLLEHTEPGIALLDLHPILVHLAATGDLDGMEQDSMGNVRFDVTPMVDRLRG